MPASVHRQADEDDSESGCADLEQWYVPASKRNG